MIRILEQEKAICDALSMDRKTSHLILTWQDIVEAKLKLDCENLNPHFAPDSSQSPPKKKHNLGSLFKDVEEKQKGGD